MKRFILLLTIAVVAAACISKKVSEPIENSQAFIAPQDSSIEALQPADASLPADASQSIEASIPVELEQSADTSASAESHESLEPSGPVVAETEEPAAAEGGELVFEVTEGETVEQFAESTEVEECYPEASASVSDDVIAESSKIRYTATKPIELRCAEAFGATLLANEYDANTGVGTLVFDAAICEIGDDAFSHCCSLTAIALPEGVTAIGARAFTECKRLADVSLPATLSSIGDKAFSGCSYLSEILLPGSVETIGKGAFADCGSLRSIFLPSSISSIGDRAFSYCHNLCSVSCLALVPPVLGVDVFEEDSYDGRIINVDERSVDAYRADEGWARYKYDIFKIADRSAYHIGDLVTYNGVQGVVFCANDNIVKLVSVAETSSEWGMYGLREGASDYEHGMANADIIKERGYFDALPTFVWCAEQGEGWYLPAFNELSSLYDVREAINKTLSTNGYATLSNYYWSSTENLGSYYAYYYCFSDICYCDRGRKATTNSVRAVAAF